MKNYMYTDKKAPANSIYDLIQYLKNEESSNRYVYRGQVKEYQAPLVPSRYRKHITYTDNKITNNDKKYKLSLKKIGVEFYGDYVANFEKYKKDLIPPEGVVSREILASIYEKASHSPLLIFRQQANRVLYNYFESRIDLIKAILTKEEFQIFDFYKDRWIPSINDYDKRIIRNFGFYKPLSYLFGTALAQQYGFSSDGLDATKDIQVACFFATRKYENKYNKIEDDGVGIIYRFPCNSVYIANNDNDDYNYYSHHSLVDLDCIFENLTYDSSDISKFFNSFKLHYTQRMKGKYSSLTGLKLPKKFYKDSRIYRQKAVILLPDEIREDDHSSEFSVIDTWLPKYQYIEDMSVREGVEKFYFKHSSNNKVELSREELWPREDPILHLVIWILTSICQRTFSKDNHMIIQRLDLIDGGYNSAEFLNRCINIALENLAVISKDNTVVLLE